MIPLLTCVDPESFVRGGPTLTMFFLVDEGREDPSTTISGPSSAFRWRADDGPTMNAGLVALRFFRGSGPVLLENPIFL